MSKTQQSELLPPVNGGALLAPTPVSILQQAVSAGANVETLTKLLELQERWEANEARKAFVKALADFKANPPRLEKTKQVGYGEGSKRTSYSYTPLDEAASTIGQALSKHGLSFRWETKQVEGRISVTCILQHEQGHRESVTLEATPDNSGSKNSVQAIGSTVTYLERYTLLAATGLATTNQDSDGVTMQAASDFVESIESAEAHELEGRYKEAVRGALQAKDPKAVALFMQAREKRERELSA